MDQLIAQILATIEGRFAVEASGTVLELIRAAAPERIHRGEVIRLRRTAAAEGGYRTLLLVPVSDPNDTRDALKWASVARSCLRDPETADLYLFVLGGALPDYDCAAIEADDRFCRKFVQRASETNAEIVARTFLASPSAHAAPTPVLVEPLSSALVRTAAHHTWLDDATRDKWRASLLSGNTGGYLAELLLDAGDD